MNVEAIAHSLCGRYTQLSAFSGYLESNLSVPHDGYLIGAYIVEEPGNKIRVTDDGDLLFTAAVAGSKMSYSTFRKYREIAGSCGVTLSDAGDLDMWCTEETAGFSLARFFEAAHRIAHYADGTVAKAASRFHDEVAKALEAAFPRALLRNVKITGGSGHQLQFPFAIAKEFDIHTVIQTVAAVEERVDWGGVYRAWGKFGDVLKNGDIVVKRVAILESASQPDLDRARLALGENADVILFEGAEHLVRALSA